jgi:hypothetical protein
MDDGTRYLVDSESQDLVSPLRTTEARDHPIYSEVRQG